MHNDSDQLDALPLAEETALWLETAGGSLPARERLIELHLPLVRMLAARLFARRIDHDLEFGEYLQFATVGLIEAIDRFDPSREILFRNFARHRIIGAVLNGIEHLSEKREQISTRKRLLAERHSSVNAALHQDHKDVFQQLAEVAIGLALGFILDEPADSQQDEAILPENQYSRLELKQMQERIRTLVERLPQRERMVIKYHYFNHIPFNLIAETLGVTNGRVSQLHRQALELLRETAKSVKACDVAW